jgi:hypothetical protein
MPNIDDIWPIVLFEGSAWRMPLLLEWFTPVLALAVILERFP